MSERQKGTGNSFYGKHHTEETKQKLRQINLAKNLSEEVKSRIGLRSGIGRRGKHFSEESKRKIANALKGRFDGMNNPFYGRRHTSETIQKLKTINQNRSEEWKRKLSISHMGHPGSNRGKKLSADTRRKIREARLKQVFPFKDSLPETMMQERLTRMNVTFRKHEPILGQPDLFVEPNVCIFVDGCFWHGCPKCHPENERGYIVKRRAFDKFVTQELSRQGYSVFRFWEHEIKDPTSELEGRIMETIHACRNY